MYTISRLRRIGSMARILNPKNDTPFFSKEDVIYNFGDKIIKNDINEYNTKFLEENLENNVFIRFDENNGVTRLFEYYIINMDKEDIIERMGVEIGLLKDMIHENIVRYRTFKIDQLL